MALSPHQPGGPKRRVVSEINVTPLVDVMLVLLIIFMVTAGVQSLEAQAEHEHILEEAEAILDQAYKARTEPEHNKVDIQLPRLDSERVNLEEAQKLKLEVNESLVFSMGGTVILECLKQSPAMSDFLGSHASDTDREAEQAAFEPCLRALGEKLVDNHKLQQDKELYVLADRRLGYGLVLRVMAAVRQAGVTRFGLVAEPGLLGDATVDRTPEALQ